MCPVWDHGLRAFQPYLAEFPSDLASPFPSLQRAMERLDAHMTGGGTAHNRQTSASALRFGDLTNLLRCGRSLQHGVLELLNDSEIANWSTAVPQAGCTRLPPSTVPAGNSLWWPVRVPL
jgi:hypothetical protein